MTGVIIITKKTIICSAIAAAVGGIILLRSSIIRFRRIRNNELKKGLRNLFISHGFPSNIAEDIAQIGIKYQFDHEARDRVLAEYIEKHFNEIPDEW